MNEDKIISFIKKEDYNAAESLFRESLPPQDDEQLFLTFGMFLQRKNYLKAARHYLENCLKLNPENPFALANLANIYNSLGLLEKAAEYYQKALKIDTGHSQIMSNYANILLKLNRYEESLEYYQKALQVDPKNYLAFSDMLVAMNYTNNNLHDIYQWHQKFSESIKEIQKELPPYKHEKIKIGYVSADFKRHSVAYFIEGIFHFHNKDLFEIHAYSDLEHEDSISQRLKSMVDYWRPVYQLDDDQLCQKIRQDEIDILVDLGSHTGRRSQVFALRAAPRQLSYCGYPNTSGLINMDYRLVDNITDENGDEFHSETLYRLPRCFLAFCPPDDAPEVNESPCLEKGFITFGSFNNFTKVTTKVLSCWCQLLKKIPNSRLLIKSKHFNDQEYRQKIKDFFMSRGIDQQRLSIHGYELKLKNHLEWYHKVDIALDPFPYNGTTTTCEALYMGVPTITLKGNCHANRVGASLLSAVKLSSFIAKDKKNYRDIAVKLAKDPHLLAELRRNLRTNLLSSPLCNAADLTVQIEKAFIKINEA